MQNSFFEVAKSFFNPETLIPFLIGAIFLSVLGNAISDILKAIIGNSINDAIKIALGSVLIFIFCVWLVAKSLAKNLQPVDLGKSSPRKHKGLILLVSREEPCRKAIEHHLPQLKYCWLICSSQTLNVAKKLQQDFPKLIIPEPLIIKDVYDPVEFSHAVINIYDNLPNHWTKNDIIADFTGMTAQGSVGMTIASLLMRQSSLQYTPAESRDGKPTGNSLNPIEIVLTKRRLSRSQKLTKVG
ncbi:MAG: CRISPR-associated protein [Cyanobacteria bacterium J06635_10]